MTGRYPGASPTTIAETVINPLEQQINGVEHAIYMQSSGDPDGSFTITVTFRLGTNLDDAQVQTQNRVSQAEPRLPDVVRQIGLVTQKRSPDLTMVVFLRSPDRRYDSLYLRNYAVIQYRHALLTSDGRRPRVGRATTRCGCGSTRADRGALVTADECSPPFANKTRRWRKPGSAASRHCGTQFGYRQRAGPAGRG